MSGVVPPQDDTGKTSAEPQPQPQPFLTIDYLPLEVPDAPAPPPSSGGGKSSRRAVPGKVRSRPVTVTVPPRHRGFLVVLEWGMMIVIGGVAFGLLVTPAVRNASRAARTTACAGNLRRLGQMFQMYVADYDGQYPPLPPAPTLEQATQPRADRPDLAWTARLSPYRDKRNPKAAEDDPFVCPAADGMPTYAYNAALGATVFPEYDPNGHPATDAAVAVPGRTFLAFDTANLDVRAQNLAGWRFYYGGKNQPRFRPGDFVLPTEGVRHDWMRPRHAGDAALAVYCDGHVHAVDDFSVRMERHNPFDPAASPLAGRGG